MPTLDPMLRERLYRPVPSARCSGSSVASVTLTVSACTVARICEYEAMRQDPPHSCFQEALTIAKLNQAPTNSREPSLSSDCMSCVDRAEKSVGLQWWGPSQRQAAF